jgi:hypothetical protein
LFGRAVENVEGAVGGWSQCPNRRLWRETLESGKGNGENGK